MINHLDLFSGIGGFALAVDRVWPGSEHIFCDNDPFCQQVLKKHWPEAKIYADIRTIAHTQGKRKKGLRLEWQQNPENSEIGDIDLVSGGFPCQPFSAAGLRKGTEDDRYLWPEMFRVIQFAKPSWVVAENVRGLATWSDGMVLEQVCSDLEGEGYEVQPLIIPAVGVNAPHRRERIWIIANTGRRDGSRAEVNRKLKRSLFGAENAVEPKRPDSHERKGIDTNSDNVGPQKQGPEQQTGRGRQFYKVVSDVASDRRQRGGATAKTQKGHAPGSQQAGKLERRFEGSHRYVADTPGWQSREQAKPEGREDFERGGWEEPWLEVATRLCGVDDGLPAELDGFKLSKAQHRTQRLKALGNAIVPQVAVQILLAIKEAGV